MRRRHHVALSTLLIAGIVFLCTQNTLPDALEASKPNGKIQGGHIDDIPAEGQRINPAPASLVNAGSLPAELAPPSGPTLDESPQSTFLLPNFGVVAPESEANKPDLLLPAPPPPPTSDSENLNHEVALPFQQDLELDLPVTVLQNVRTRKAHNYNIDGPTTYAYATFMATRNPSLKDPYFLAIHSLIYRILWSPRSQTAKYPFIVFVAAHVTSEQRALLAGAGAVVRELAPLEWNPNVPGVQPRWKDLFAKLNMWKETQFSRILFLDADAFPMTNIDAMFDNTPMQQCDDTKMQPDDFLPDGTPVCEPYIFAGVPHDPGNAVNPHINVGAMVITPSLRMHQRLLQNYVKTDRYDCLMAEQAFLNWQFSPGGPFPPTLLEKKWGGYFPGEDEEGKLNVVHEKMWIVEGGWIKKEWEDGWKELMGFYEGPEFATLREQDGAAT